MTGDYNHGEGRDLSPDSNCICHDPESIPMGSGMAGDNDDQGDVRDCCPNADCSWHDPERIPKGKCWFRKHGFYFSEQHGRVQRYICIKCGKTFCQRTDSDKWYLHFDNISISALNKRWLIGESVKELAREYGITPQMVRTRLRRCDVFARSVDDGTKDPDDDPHEAL